MEMLCLIVLPMHLSLHSFECTVFSNTAMTSPFQPRVPSHPQQHYPASQGLVMGLSQGLGSTGSSDSRGGLTDTALVNSVTGGGSGGGGGGSSQAVQPHKDFNTAILCRIGQETIQEIVAKTNELFAQLKLLQSAMNAGQLISNQDERRAALQENVKNIGLLFKRLRHTYEKCNENCAVMEYIHIESLVPMKDDVDSKQEDKKVSENVKYCTEEYKKYVELVMLKNRQIKEVIDTLRSAVWDINTMLFMRNHKHTDIM